MCVQMHAHVCSRCVYFLGLQKQSLRFRELVIQKAPAPEPC